MDHPRSFLVLSRVASRLRFPVPLHLIFPARTHLRFHHLNRVQCLRTIPALYLPFCHPQHLVVGQVTFHHWLHPSARALDPHRCRVLVHHDLQARLLLRTRRSFRVVFRARQDLKYRLPRRPRLRTFCLLQKLGKPPSQIRVD